MKPKIEGYECKTKKIKKKDANNAHKKKKLK
jgi:hypothetical protein